MGEIDRFEDIMDNWRRWMSQDAPVDGYPSQSAVLTTGGASESFDVLCEHLDAWLAETANAVIESLPPVQQAAIHHEYLRAVYRFRDLAGALTLAKIAVRAGLVARNVYL